MHRFSYEVRKGLQAGQLSWDELFAEHPDSAELIALMSQCGLDGFELYTLIVSSGGVQVLAVPLFFTRYSLASTLDGKARKIVGSLERFAPILLKPKVLGVGFVEGEWTQVGVNPWCDPGTIAGAMSGAIEYLDSFAKRLSAQIIALKDFTAETIRALPPGVLQQFAQAVSLPFCQMRVEFSSFDDYLESLPRKVRQDLRRKMRQSANVVIHYTQDVGPWLDDIYRLYFEQAQRSDISFGIHGKQYFAEVCEQVPGAKYILFFVQDQLIGFNLIVDRGALLVDKYIGMDETEGRLHNLYFVAWAEKIRYCIEHKIPLLHLGAAAEGVKVRYGAGIIPSYVLFRHRDPLLNWLLRKLAPALSYEPAVSGPEHLVARLRQAEASSSSPEKAPLVTHLGD